MSSEPTPSLPATPATQLARDDRRMAVRYSCTVKSLCQTKRARNEDFWWWGTILDISTTGVGVLITRRFEPGTQLMIEPLTKQETFPPLLVCVLRVTEQTRAGWLHGCDIIRPLAGQTGTRTQSLPEQGRSSSANG